MNKYDQNVFNLSRGGPSARRTDCKHQPWRLPSLPWDPNIHNASPKVVVISAAALRRVNDVEPRMGSEGHAGTAQREESGASQLDHTLLARTSVHVSAAATHC